MKRRVTVEEAFALIGSTRRLGQRETLCVESALGRYLAEDLYAPIALPPFHNSAVDGFALGSLSNNFVVVATLGAGDSFSGELLPEQACRIMTGAKIPLGTKAVAMQEFVLAAGDRIQVEKTVSQNDHIRFAGEDIGKGMLVAKAGTQVGARHVGLFSALGVSSIQVERKPSVSIVSTGSELVDPGQPLEEGQVYYCTGPMLSAQAELAGARVLGVQKIADDKERIIHALQAALCADIVITVGGMADGAFDYGRSALAELCVEPVFFEGQWRPGKPLFFGTLGEKLIFGLPGNPVAAFVMFRIFVEAAICGRDPNWHYAPIVGQRPKASDKAQFLRAKRTRGGLELVPGQGSHQLFNLALSDAIVWVPKGESADEAYPFLPVET